MRLNNAEKGSSRRLRAVLIFVALASPVQAALGDPVIIPSGSESREVESRNNPIRVGDAAVVKGDIKSENGAIALGDQVLVDGQIQSRNGAITIGDELTAGDISNRNGVISLGEGSEVGDMDNRNGAIVIGRQSQAGDVRTRNGSVRLEAGAAADEVETRNGRILVEPESRINGSVRSRNGKIRISGASVAKDIASRNGAIELVDVNVGGHIRSHNGKIKIGGGSEINGDVVIDWSELDVSGWSAGSKSELEIVIEGNTRVSGSVVLKLPREDRSRHTGRIALGPNASVLGEVIVSGGVESDLRGEVRGGRLVQD